MHLPLFQDYFFFVFLISWDVHLLEVVVMGMEL